MKIEKVTYYCDEHGGKIDDGDRNVLRVTTSSGTTWFTMDLCGACAGQMADNAALLQARLNMEIKDGD